MTTSIVSKSSGTQGALQVNGVDSVVFDSTGIDSGLNLTASAAANTLTITLQPCGLRFRNATLTNGTPALVVASSALSLTLSATDSFGLTTAFGNQRIAVLAFNDAGVMRLAASALYGGVQLDETNLLSATTTATTATAIGAGVAITSKAYRVIGFVDATFTTATGWGSLVLVQGVGGQALTAMSSLGYGQKWTDVTGSRALSTLYYNTTGKPISVSAWYVTSTANTFTMYVNGVLVDYKSLNSPSSSFLSVEGIVPPNASYQIQSTAAALSGWVELR